MKRRRFRTELKPGHKGSAVIVPFDPATIWGTRAVAIPNPRYKMGHLVRGTLEGRKFDGWIGHRWGRFFIIVDEDLQKAAGVRPGDLVEVVVEPRVARRAKASAKRRGTTR